MSAAELIEITLRTVVTVLVALVSWITLTLIGHDTELAVLNAQLGGMRHTLDTVAEDVRYLRRNNAN